jgi:uncharacterized protein with FMN-binding domain
MNRDQVHSMMTALVIGGSVVGGIILTQHEVGGHNLSFPTTKPSSSGKPTPSASGSPSTSASGGTVTKTGDLYQGGDQWGDYAQVTVTKVNGAVTAVTLPKSYATSQWQGAYPVLAQSAVQSNGAPVANLSGATYASNAFNGALASAMSKF